MPFFLGMAGDMRQGRRIAEQHFRPDSLNIAYETIDFFRRHFEGRNQVGAQQFIAQQPDFILSAKLDGRAPDHRLGITDIDIPPARRAPFGGHVVADPLPANIKNQRFAAGTPGIEPGQPDGIIGLQIFEMRSDLGLGQ